MYEFQNKQVKPAEPHSTQWISHVVQSKTGFVDKFRAYIQHIKNVISDTSVHCDKAH